MVYQPPAHQRPSINLDHSGRTRSWQEVEAHNVDIGDTWRNHGTVRGLGVRKTDILIWAGESRQPFVMPRHELITVFHHDLPVYATCPICNLPDKHFNGHRW